MIIAAAAFLAIQVPAPYTVQTIFKHDVEGAECTSVNDNSQVLCDIDPGDKLLTPYRTFVWQDGQFTEILAPESDVLDDPVSVCGGAMNNDGEVIGTVNGGMPHLYSFDFEWTKSTGMHELKVNNYRYFEPHAINNNGKILGRAWDMDGKETAGILSGGGYTALYETKEDFDPAYILTDHDVVGCEKDDLSTERGWGCFIPPGTHDITRLSLPDYVPNPDPFRNPYSSLRAINNGGWMVGVVNMNTTPQYSLQDQIGAVWSPDNTFYSLGAGFIPKAINDQGVIVGAQYELLERYFPHPFRAFIYDSTHGIRFLDSMVPYGTPALTNAVSINNKGEIVCRGPENDWYLLKPAS